MSIRNPLFILFFAVAAVSAYGTESSRTAAWWDGKHLSGDWLGARTLLEDNGLTLEGRWRGIYFGVLASQNGPGNAFSQELSFAAQIDVAKALRWEGIDGLTLFGEGRWRDPGPHANPANITDAFGLFNPSRYAGGVGWRMMNFGVRYTAPQFFGVKKGLTLAGGWIQPQKEFIEQPLAKLFANNAMASAEGIGGNIPFSSSLTTWGGTVEAKPSEWSYVKTGLFMSFPRAVSPDNNGLMFGGYASEPWQNGLFFMGEAGVMPELGSGKLPGHYAFGAYVYGNEAPGGGNQSGYYWQADQKLWRERKGSDEGLGMFSLFVFAPRRENLYDFYMHGGLVYDGLIPGRPRDQLLAGIAMGNYGDAAAKVDLHPTQTVLMEAGYRLKLSGWSFVQPFAQYISRPVGLPGVANAAILGVFVGVDF